jgi:glycosyltransferase involved in cell wall biosynthesis
MHILILTDRDWDHPEAGGTGIHLTGSVWSWLEAGHKVTIIAGGFPDCQPVEKHGDLTIHRIGNRKTVFPRTIINGIFGRLPKVDVTLEIINGITWMSPIWLRGPRVTLIHHVHKGQYHDEMGLKGPLAAWMFETAPLRRLYRGSRFLTVSQATKDEIVSEHRVPAESITVVNPGVYSDQFITASETSEPTMLYLGRVKAYKRVEHLLDVLEAVDGLSLDIVGDGNHRENLEADVTARGLGKRVRFHGHVSEEEKCRLLATAWVAVTASAAEGWSSSTIEAAASATPSVAHPVGGLKESIIDGQTGIHAEDVPEMITAIRSLIEDEELRLRLGRQARERAQSLTWERSAQGILDVLLEAAGEKVNSGIPSTLGMDVASLEGQVAVGAGVTTPAEVGPDA